MDRELSIIFAGISAKYDALKAALTDEQRVEFEKAFNSLREKAKKGYGELTESEQRIFDEYFNL